MACQPKEKGYSGESTKEEENRARNCRKQITNRKKYLLSAKRTNLITSILNYIGALYHYLRAALRGEIILGNAQRTGVVCRIKRSEVDRSEDEGDLIKVKVYEHKTGKAKPVVVFFEREIGNALKHFNDKILSITQNSGSIDQDK